MSNRIRIAVAVSVMTLPLALVACSSSSSGGSSSSSASSTASNGSSAPAGGDATYAATPPAGVQGITVVVKPGTVKPDGTAIVGAAGPTSLKGMIAYVVTADKDVASEIWAEGKPLDANGATSFELTALQRTYNFQVVVPQQPLTTKEYPAGTKLAAESAVFPVTVTE